MGKMKEQSVETDLSGALPDWAIREASTCLAHGGQVSEIESKLIANGLNPQQASSATQQWFVQRFRLVNQEREGNARSIRYKMQIGIGLVLCSLITIALMLESYSWEWQFIWNRYMFRKFLSVVSAGFFVTGVRLIRLAWRQRSVHPNEEITK